MTNKCSAFMNWWNTHCVIGAEQLSINAFNAGLEVAAKLCEERGQRWQEITPNVISPVACAASDCADGIRTLKE